MAVRSASNSSDRDGELEGETGSLRLGITRAKGRIDCRSTIKQALAPSRQGSRYRCEFVAAQIDDQRVEKHQNDGRRWIAVQHG
jgi:hypothetical protein